MSGIVTTDFNLITEDFVLKSTQKRILHFDMDCFYAAVEMRDQPHLQHVPLAIGGPPNTRSVLCTSNYLARRFGVKSAMSSSQAVRLCPSLVILPPRFDKYKKESLKIAEIFKRYTSFIEFLSLDEAFLDVTQSCKGGGLFASQIAKEIKLAVKKETGLTISAGVSFNKFLAKVGSDWKKPDGFFVIPPENRESFMKNLAVKFIFGVGQKTLKKLHDLNIHTCSDIQKRSLQELRAIFGSRYLDIYYLSHGLDFRNVDSEHRRKSVSTEETFSKDIYTEEELVLKLKELYEDWCRRFVKYSQQEIKSAVVKVKYHDFSQTTHEVKLNQKPSIEIFMQLLKEVLIKRNDPIRLLGLGVRIDEENKTQQLRFNCLDNVNLNSDFEFCNNGQILNE